MQRMNMALSGSVLILAASIGFSAIAAEGVPPLATLGPPPIPVDNPMTPEKVELGKKTILGRAALRQRLHALRRMPSS